MSLSKSLPTKATFVFICGDKVVSGKGYTRSISIAYPPPLLMEDHTGILTSIVQEYKWMDIDVSIHAEEIILSHGEKISKKLVEDCSIEELIFAITKKAESKT